MNRLIASAVLSGLALQLAAPPLELWIVSFVALAPVLYVLAERSFRDWVLAGAIVGLINAACLVDAVIKWGPPTALALTLFAASMVAIPFALAGWLAPRLKSTLRPYVFVLIWTLFSWFVDELLYTTISFAAPVALGAPRLLGFVEWFGALGLEAVVVGFAAVLVDALRRPRSALLLPLFSLLPLSALLPRIDSPASGRIVGIQPNVHWSDYASTGWSLERRTTIEELFDDLTREASTLGGTIVWPENGNTLANAQLDRRISILTEMLAEEDVDLLAAGRELEDGREYLSVFRFTGEGVAARARKANLVPFAESDLEPGDPAVIGTNAGPIGVSVCFDSLFSSHARELVRAGAQQLVVTTDDTSFGATTIPRRHLAYSILRAAELGRSLVFISNEGPAVSYDPTARAVRQHSGDQRRAIYAIDAPLVAARTAADRGLRHALPLLLLAFALTRLHAPIRSRSTVRIRHLVVAPIFALAFGVATDLSLRARAEGLSAIATDFSRRARGQAGADALGPLFRQSQEKSCGAAALAFALTFLGDRVFEDRLLPVLGRGKEATTMTDLKLTAEARSFTANASRVGSIDGLRFGPGIVHLLHIRPSHYVAAIQRDGRDVLLLDPAIGAVLRVKVEELASRWSGYALEIRNRSAEIIPAAESSPAAEHALKSGSRGARGDR